MEAGHAGRSGGAAGRAIQHAAPWLTERSNEVFDEWRTAGLQFERHGRGVLLAHENAEHCDERLQQQDVFSAHGSVAEVLDG